MSLLLILVCFSNTFSQTKKNQSDTKKTYSELKANREAKYYLGLFWGYNINQHSADFSQLSGYPNCCTQFSGSDAKGSGLSAGALIEFPKFLEQEKLNFELRLFYSDISSNFLVENVNIGNVLLANPSDPKNPIVSQALVNHKLDASLALLGLEPSLNYNFWDKMYLKAGFKLGYLLTNKFSQAEILVQPESYTFMDDRLIRNDFTDKEIPNSNLLQLHFSLGLSYDYQLKNDLIISPEIKYNFALMNLADVNWKANYLQFGAAFKLPVYPSIDKPERDTTIFRRDTVVNTSKEIITEQIKLINSNTKNDVVEAEDYNLNVKTIIENYEKLIPFKSELTVSVKAVGITKKGERIEKPRMEIEETETEESFALLPQIYFKESSSDLSQTGLNLRSKDQISGFDENKLPWNTMEIYSDLLNILGSRLKSTSQNSEITIVGCTSEKAIEKNNLELSKARAEAIKNYLVNIWDVEAKRIKTKAQGKPDNAGNELYAEGILENQRAEIKSKDLKLLFPVILKDVKKTSNPPEVEIIPSISSNLKIKDWGVKVTQSSKTLREFEGDENLDLPFIWTVEENPMPEYETPIEITLDATNELGLSKVARTELKIEQKTIKKKRYQLKDDKKIEKYALIVFDFASSQLNEQHKSILDLVKSKIEKNSKVEVIGYTDMTGEEKINYQLSHDRAKEVFNYLGLNSKNGTFKGVGENTPLFDNNTTSGRSYNRTVIVTIETPMTK